jgi:hypothetical protein
MLALALSRVRSVSSPVVSGGEGVGRQRAALRSDATKISKSERDCQRDSLTQVDRMEQMAGQ